MTDSDSTPNIIGSLVHWALAVRDSPVQARLRSTLTRARTAPLVDRALTDPAIARRLGPLAPHQRPAALSALSVIAGARGLQHSGATTLGRSLAVLSGPHAVNALATAPGMSQPNAARLLGSAVTLAGERGPVNLIEFTDLLTHWDDLDLRARSRYLVDFHASQAPSA